MRERWRHLREEDESGSVLLLILGFGVVVLALVLVVASISALHIERKQLLAAADAAALDAASLLDRDAFFQEPGEGFVISDGAVLARVEDYLDDYATVMGLDGVAILEASVGEDQRTITVTLSSRADIPFVPSLVPGIADAIRVEATSVARGF